MALNDNALFTAAVGYVYTAPVGTAAPSPAQIEAFEAGVTGNEEQTVTITGTPTGGSFTLTYDGSTTAGIAFDAAASLVKTRLEALTNIASGSLTVTGGPGPGTPYVVKFGGTLAGDNIAQMTASAASLTGGSTPAVTVTTTSAGWDWTDLGHTSREDLPEFGFEGGDTEILGTWRNASLREVITEVATDHVIIQLHQFDEEGLALYYGVDNNSVTEGVFAVGEAATATTNRALLIVIVDGDTKIGFYARKAAIRREDSITMAVDGFAVMPIRATFLKDGDEDLFSWISSDTGVNPGDDSI
jgi:hypothetical protein